MIPLTESNFSFIKFNQLRVKACIDRFLFSFGAIDTYDNKNFTTLDFFTNHTRNINEECVFCFVSRKMTYITITGDAKFQIKYKSLQCRSVLPLNNVTVKILASRCLTHVQTLIVAPDPNLYLNCSESLSLKVWTYIFQTF